MEHIPRVERIDWFVRPGEPSRARPPPPPLPALWARPLRPPGRLGIVFCEWAGSGLAWGPPRCDGHVDHDRRLDIDDRQRLRPCRFVLGDPAEPLTHVVVPHPPLKAADAWNGRPLLKVFPVVSRWHSAKCGHVAPTPRARR